MCSEKTNLFHKTKNVRSKGNKKYRNVCYEQALVQIEISQQELETEISKNAELQSQNARMTAKLSSAEYS